MNKKKGFIIIFDKWYFIILAILCIFVILGDTWETYDININFNALTNNKEETHNNYENYSKIYLNQIKENLSLLNKDYYFLKCNGSIPKIKYNKCEKLYRKISNLTDTYNSIINGSYIPIKPEIKKIIKNPNKEEKFISIKKVKNSTIFDDVPTSRNYDSYSKKTDTTLFNKSFKYEFKGNNYKIKLELSKQKYNLYSNYQKSYEYYGSLPPNWKTSYYKMFINEGNDNGIINEIITKIKNNPNIHSNEDKLKAVINLVQNIPYDYNSYYNLNDDLKYPYETIYLNKGVCSDKSILLIKLLLHLNYNTVGFIFNKANHMAVGIKCPSNYGNFNTNYCFIETTGITPIGIVPKNYGIYGGISLDKNPEILYFGGEKTYFGIIKAKQNQKKLSKVYGDDYLNMNSNEKTLTEKMTLYKDKMKKLEPKIEKLNQMYDFNDCNEITYIGSEKEKTCNFYYEQISKIDNEYNDYSNKYNKLVDEYNNLIIN